MEGVQNLPCIFGLGVPATGLTVFSSDLEPATVEQKYAGDEHTVICNKASPPVEAAKVNSDQLRQLSLVTWF